MKATLGIGFEERSDAFDFSVSLQDARKSLGMENPTTAGAPGQRPGKAAEKAIEAEKKDFSLKEGETITVNIGGRGRRAPGGASKVQSDEQALFSIKPPPSAGGGAGGAMPFLPPPPSVADMKAKKPTQQSQSAQDLGFDDGDFGEFQ